MKSLKLLISLFIISLCSACVSYPKTAAFDLPQGARVGYQVKLSEEIGHTHYGTTVFNNIDRPYLDYDWGLNDYANKEAVRLLTEYGFEPVLVDEVSSQNMVAELEATDFDALTEEKLKLIQESQAERLGVLKNQYRIAALISMHSAPGVVATECGSYGCSEFEAKRPGFYSRGLALLPPFLHAVLPSRTSASVIDPDTPVYAFTGRYAIANPQLLHMKGFKPNKFKAMTIDEWAQVKTKLYELITRNLENYVQALRAGADGNGGFVRDVKAN